MIRACLDLVYVQKLYIDVETLIIFQPENGEQVLEVLDNLILSSAIDIIMIDSVAVLLLKSEIEGEIGDSKVGLQASIMSQDFRKLTTSISNSKCTEILINQLREKIAVIFGNTETATGGNALNFYSSIRLDIRRGIQIKNADEVFGNRTKVKVVKNKNSLPFQNGRI